MSEIDSLGTMLHQELRGLYDAEKRLTRAIPKMLKKTTNAGLRQALETSLEDTHTHIARLEETFELINETAQSRVCAAMMGILEEGEQHLAADYASDALRDVAIVGDSLRVKHYEVAGYRNAIAHARQLRMVDVADLLAETLTEEAAANERLTAVCKPLIAAAMDGQGQEQEQESGVAASSSFTLREWPSVG